VNLLDLAPRTGASLRRLMPSRGRRHKIDESLERLLAEPEHPKTAIPLAARVGGEPNVGSRHFLACKRTGGKPPNSAVAGTACRKPPFDAGTGIDDSYGWPGLTGMQKPLHLSPACRPFSAVFLRSFGRMPCWSAKCASPRPSRTSRCNARPWRVSAASVSIKTPTAALSLNGPGMTMNGQCIRPKYSPAPPLSRCRWGQPLG
jgi:hypothetical protein